jgi:hypothetical protein
MPFQGPEFENEGDPGPKFTENWCEMPDLGSFISVSLVYDWLEVERTIATVLSGSLSEQKQCFMLHSKVAELVQTSEAPKTCAVPEFHLKKISNILKQLHMLSSYDFILHPFNYQSHSCNSGVLRILAFMISMPFPILLTAHFLQSLKPFFNHSAAFSLPSLVATVFHKAEVCATCKNTICSLQ